MDNKTRIRYFKDNKIIAVDPGKNGGIVIYSKDLKKVVEVAKMPQSPMELLSFLKIYSVNSTCYLEKVGGLPGMGGNAMFNFGCGYGHLEMALLACKIPTISVTPQKWQKSLQLGNKGNKSTSEWKNKLKRKAEQLFPYVGKITLATSDALLIAQYAINQEKM
jgi:hypothetical protein